MHKPVQEGVRRYSRESLGEDERLDLVKDLALVAHPEVALFFLDVLSAPKEAAPFLEVLNVLEVCDINEHPTYLALGQQLLRLLAQTDDNTTKVYVTKAAVNFPDVPGIRDALTGVLLDTTSPLDARLHAFQFVKRAGDSTQGRSAVEQLLADPELSEDASELLAKWNSLSPPAT